MAASFNVSTNKLHIDVVQVGDTLVEWVQARLDRFEVLGISGNGTCSSFDPATNILTLAAVTVGNETYRGVSLRVDQLSDLTSDGTAPVAPGRQVVNINDIVSSVSSGKGLASFDAGAGAYMFFDDMLQKGWGNYVAHELTVTNFGADDVIYFDGNGVKGVAATDAVYSLRNDIGGGNVFVTAKPATDSGGLTYSQINLMGVKVGGGYDYFPSVAQFNSYPVGDILLG
jgi:hypothetical protein